MAADASRDLDTLYAVPPTEFTRRRSELAARLREAERREEAAAVRRMKKPSVPVWAINRLAREQAAAVREFVDATDRLRREQVGGRDTMVDATQAQRRTLQGLVRSAEAILRQNGFSPTPQTLERVSRTLLGAAADRDGRRELLDGRLTDERQAPGFDALARTRIAPARDFPRERSKPLDEPGRTARMRAAGDGRRRAGALEERRRQKTVEQRQAAEARAEELARKARSLEDEAATREREATEATRAVSELRQQVREAESRARERNREARNAAAAAKRARREAARMAGKLR